MTDELLNPPGRPCRCGAPECSDASAWSAVGDVERVIRRVQSESPRLRVDVGRVVTEAAEQIRQQAAHHQPVRTPPGRPLENREYGTRHQPPRLDFAASLNTLGVKFIGGLDKAINRATRKDPS